MTKKVDTATFEDLVSKATGRVLVDFSATWCGPCQMVAPILNEIATEHEGEIEIYTLDIDESREVAIRYGVNSVPTMILFENGNALRQTIGAQPKEAILSFLDL